MNDVDLISLALCKDLLSTDERDDALLAAVIGSCSVRFQRCLLRKVLERSIVCCFDSLGAQELLLAEYPVRSVGPVRCDPARAFGEESELPEASWYCAPVPYTRCSRTCRRR